MMRMIHQFGSKLPTARETSVISCQISYFKAMICASDVCLGYSGRGLNEDVVRLSLIIFLFLVVPSAHSSGTG